MPRPKPDLAFGYSQAAFDTNQRTAIGLLVNELKQSYAMPVRSLRFPFLQIEFRALAMGGSPFGAKNQAASAGAIAMNGLLELNRRNSAEPGFDSDNPQFFSLTMNNIYASVNVHWLSHSAENGSIRYNMGTLSDHLLTESGGLKAVYQIVKNILDYAVNERLAKIREALDTYMQNFVVEREKAIHGRDSASESQAEEQRISPRHLGVNVHPSSDRQPAKRRKLGHPARGDIAEGILDRPAEQLQSGRATRTITKKALPSIRQKERHHRNAPPAIPVRASSRIAKLARRGQSS